MGQVPVETDGIQVTVRYFASARSRRSRPTTREASWPTSYGNAPAENPVRIALPR
jgi:hypothetical protein